MLRYVPDFILNKCGHDEHSGTFDAFLLFLDVADFTGISNQLRREGKRGAEALNLYLGEALSNPIEQVELYGGFVSHFAGDAFCAVFPGTDAGYLKHAVEAIQEQYGKDRTCKTEIGEYPIKLRMTVSCGTLTWNIYRNEIQNEYVLSGEPMVEIKRLSKLKADLAMSETAKSAFAEAEPKLKPESFVAKKVAEEIKKSFVSKHLWGYKPDNEIRDAAYCFVNLSRLPKKQIEPALALMHEKLDNYGGYLNKLDDSDKGLLALLLFGLPKGMGNTLERACRFALELVAELPKVSLGLACGNAYAGYVGNPDTGEFTALGSALNLASRLMQQAGEGQIVTDSYLEQEMHYKYRFETAEVITPKGFVTAVHCHRLVDRLPAPPQSFMADLVGREAELQQIRQAVSDTGSRILYISGEPGIGKSRLILEALRQYPKRYFLFCDPSGHRLLEPIKQFLRQHFAYDPLLSTELNQRNFRDRWQVLAGEDKELWRIESFLGNLLGFDWEGSIWNMLPPEEKPEQQRKAFATFMAKLTETEQVLIHLDDPQWLDGTDAEYFRQLGSDKIERVVIVAACRYLEDGSSVNLEIPNWEARYMELGRLSKAAAATLIRHLLKVETLPEDTQNWIVNKADGNPLFIEQVVAYLRENDCFDDTMNLKGNLDYLSSFGIADIIGSRIDSLTEVVRNTLQHACVLGLEFNTRVLSEMLSRKLDDDLGEGKHARVWADVDELRYIFTHVLIKDTAYNRMLSDKLKTLHLLAAEAMVTIDVNHEGANADSIAYHFDKANSLDNAAVYYSRAGDYYIETFSFTRAQHCLERLFEITNDNFGENSEQAGDVIMTLGKLSIEMSDYMSAKDWYSKAEVIYAHSIGMGNEKYISALTKLAFVMEELAEFDQTQAKMEKALMQSRKTFGVDHDITAMVLYNLSNHYIRSGEYEQAQKLLHEVVKRDDISGVSETILGVKHLNDLAVTYANIGMLKRAKELFTNAYDTIHQLKKQEDPYTARVLRNLGQIAYHEGDLAKAADIHLKCLNIIEPILGTLHSNTADAYDSYANVIADLGQHKEAVEFMEKAIRIQEKLNRPQIVASYLHNLGNIYSEMQELEDQELGIKCYKESILIKKNLWKRDHPDIALSLESLGNLYYKMGEFEIALNLYQETQDMLIRIYGDNHYLIARSENRIGDVLGELGRHKEAIKHFEKSLRMYEETVGSDAVVLLSVLINFGSTLSSIGEQPKAITLLKRGLEIIMHTDAGKNHNYYTIVVDGLALCFEKNGEPEKAAEYKAMLADNAE